MKHAKRGLKVLIFRFVCAYGKIERKGMDGMNGYGSQVNCDLYLFAIQHTAPA